MSFFDTMDGCFNSVACGWAFAPAGPQGTYCSLVITGRSIAGRGGDLSGTDVRTLVSDRLAAVRVC